MNYIGMKWRLLKGRGDRVSLSIPKRGARAAPRAKKYPFRSDSALTDEYLELLGFRYQANRICLLLDITFEAYVKTPKCWDRIAKHMADGGGCRVEHGASVVNL